MSTTVDNRIVEMQFDNREFETNANASIKTLDKLKAALDMDDAARGFQEVDNAARSVNFNSLLTASQEVGKQFSAMEIAGITAISNITNRIVDLGLNLSKSLSVDQITAGWQKYADKTSAVQTIVAATGESMDVINEQLDKLNLFTDETSYNFVDMVSNIGKFTAMNIPLDQAVTSMQGIANWAAISGANASQASRAMYNLSQAIGLGSVRTQDWMSIENANMATAEFKQMAIEAAVAAGTLKKNLDGTFTTAGKELDSYETIINTTTGELEKVKKWSAGQEVTIEKFRNTLSDGWFTNDVLTQVLDKYGKFSEILLGYVDTTGVTATEWLEVVDKFKAGDETFDINSFALETGMSVEELTAALEELGDEQFELGRKAFKAAQEAKTFQEAIDATKDAVSTKWAKIFELVFGDYEEAKKIWTGLSNTLYDIFAAPLDNVIDVLAIWNKELGGRDDIFGGISTAFEGLMEIIDAVKEGFETVFPKKTIEESAQSLKKFTEGFKSFAERLKLSDKNLEKIKSGAEGIAKAVNGVRLAFKMAGKIAGTVISAIKSGFGIFRFLPNIDDLRKGIHELSGETKPIFGILHKFGDAMSELYSKFENGDLLEHISSSVTRFTFTAISKINKLKNKIVEIAGSFRTFFAPIASFTVAAANSIKEFAITVGSSISSLWNKVLNKGSKSFINGVGVDGLINLPETAKASLDKLSKIDTSGVSTFVNNVNNRMSGLGGIVGKVGGFLKKISSVIKEASKNIWIALSPLFTGLKNLFGSLWPVFKNLLSFIGDTLTKLGNDLVGISGSLDWDKIFHYGSLVLILKGVISFFIAIKEGFETLRNLGNTVGFLGTIGSSIEDFMWSLSKMKLAEAAKTVAVSLLIIAAAALVMASLPVDKLTVAMGAITVAWAELLKTISIVMDANVGVGKGVSAYAGISALVIAMATSISIITGAIYKLGTKMNPDQMKQGIIGMAAIVGMSWALVYGTDLIKNAASMFGIPVTFGSKVSNDANYTNLALAMIGIAVAVRLLTGTVKKLGKIDPDQFAQGLFGFGVIFGATAALMLTASFFMSKVGDRIKKEQYLTVATTVLLISTLIRTLTRTVNKFGKMDPDKFKQGFIGLGIMTAAIAAFMILVLPKLQDVEESSKKVKIIKTSDIMKLAVGLLSISAAFSIISQAISAIAKIPSFGAAMQGVVAFVSIVAALGLAAVAMERFGKGGTSLLAMGAGLLMLSIGFTALVPALAALSLIKWSAILKALAVLAVISVSALVAGPAVMVLGIGLLALGAGAYVAGAGMMLMAKALIMLGASSALATAGIIALATGLGEGMVIIAKKVPEALVALLEGLVAVAGKIVDLVFAIFVESKTKFISMLVDTLGELLAKIAEKAPELKESLVTILGLLLDVANELLPKIVDFIGGLIVGLLDMLLNKIIEWIPQLLEVITTGVDTLITKLEEWIPRIITIVSDAIMQLVDEVTTNVPIIVDKFLGMITDILAAVEENVPDIVDKLVGIVTTFVESVGSEENINKVINTGLDVVHNFMTGVANGIEEGIPQFVADATNLITSFLDGISAALEDEENIKKIKESVTRLCKAIITAFKNFFGIHSPSTVMTDESTHLTEGIGKGLEDGWELIKSIPGKVGGWILGGIQDGWAKAKEIGSGLVEKIGDGIDKAKEIATNVKDGLVNGLDTAKTAVASAAKNVGNAITSGIKTVLKIHSPSVIMEKIGEYVDLGLVNGINNKSDDVEDAGGNLGSGLISSIKDKISGVFSDSGDDLTITPVLDLSEVESGMSDLADMTNSTSDLALSANTDFNDYSDARQNGITVDNSNVISAINTLRDEVGALSQLIGKLNIVMDTGALVGQLTVPMDEALGKQLVYGNRGM